MPNSPASQFIGHPHKKHRLCISAERILPCTIGKSFLRACPLSSSRPWGSQRPGRPKRDQRTEGRGLHVPCFRRRLNMLPTYRYRFKPTLLHQHPLCCSCFLFPILVHTQKAQFPLRPQTLDSPKCHQIIYTEIGPPRRYPLKIIHLTETRPRPG